MSNEDILNPTYGVMPYKYKLVIDLRKELRVILGTAL